jgi:electron transport complex protein RnfG
MMRSPMLISALVLAGFACVGAVALALTEQMTAPRIQANERATLEARLNQIIARNEYDNDLVHDLQVLDSSEVMAALGTRMPITVYRARRGETPVAAVFEVVTPEGYSGDIRLLVGVRPDGRVAGVRVVTHRETPGLGDKIEIDRNDWITRFTGRSLGDPDAARWTVKRDGGAFDQFSGATITPRAVTHAVRRVLSYAAEPALPLYAAASAEPIVGEDDGPVPALESPEP